MNLTYLNRTIRFIIVIAATILLFVSFFYLSKVTYPFIIGFLIAFLMNPLVNFLQFKCKLPRAFAVVLSILLILSIFAGLVSLLIAEIVAGAAYLGEVVPKHIDIIIRYIEDLFAAQIIPLYNKISQTFNNLGTGQQDTIMTNIDKVGEQVGTVMGDFLQSFFLNIPIFLSWFPNAASVLIFSLLATFFISKDWARLSLKFGKFFPSKWLNSGKTVFFELKKALFGFLKAQLTLVSITTVIILIGLLILRVDYAITIALLTGIVDIIPYLGTGLIFVPWIIYEIITGQIVLAIGLSVLYIIVLVQRQIMEPKILSSNIGLDPLATLIALFVGFKLFGFIGLIIGPVSLVIVTSLHRAKVFHDIWRFIKGDSEIPK
ncbi:MULTISPECIES: sporulation integral membrane protein YtvI [Niallia]|uniref:Sporulation integral membrane protein YtvI n=1 Tax=Niallia circulans TaxID=1397 RepID=A0A268FAH4_NIACI|nr:sporulation integral membrane protein YtvI [Niallia circulans]AYV67439.1 sporulation integral membrane protein YtvI [Niallia circulans]AYV74205.1 sporulation integral membrane protein YtvI [Niallia circulans]NRG29346.1 sporulation integral membrane protein YtvI [Niallia circulans]PAD82381.1 sporulation integral membrane protein YtvI [Niallia circulans]QJX63384.1 sporulation integral membrane protein YtvI [Niallia circulans]